jgi:hypothetical protein
MHASEQLHRQGRIAGRPTDAISGLERMVLVSASLRQDELPDRHAKHPRIPRHT